MSQNRKGLKPDEICESNNSLSQPQSSSLDDLADIEVQKRIFADKVHGKLIFDLDGDSALIARELNIPSSFVKKVMLMVAQDGAIQIKLKN